MGRSLLGYVGLGATLIFALPAVLLGVEFMFRGRTAWGVALMAAGALMIVVEERVTTPGDVPGLVAERTVGRITPDPDTDPDANPDPESDDEQ